MANQGDPVDSPAEASTVAVGSPSLEDSFDKVLRRVVATGARHELEPGTVIANRFRIERLLGAGGMGTVYVARDQSLGRDVAIKLHHAPGGGIRLKREAIAMARLAHPNVVTVFEVGELDRHPFVVMEYVTGTTLRAWLAEQPRSVGDILAMLIAAGEGLAAAHDAGLLHRDIKPENVLIGGDGRARVGDFGLARDVDSKDEPPADDAARILSPMTQTGAVLGTPAYMAPEQLTGAVIDARADQFAFCITLWEALYKQRPYAGSSFEELARALQSGERRPFPPSPRVPARIRAALERGLATRPEDRFPSMHALIAALRDPARVRRRIAIGAAIGVAAIAAAAWFASDRSEQRLVSCTDAGAPLVAMVPRDLPAKLRAVGAVDAAVLVEGALGEFSTALATSARTACEAGRARREWSPAVLAKSETCLKVAAESARSMLTFDSVTAAQQSDIVRRAKLAMPDLTGCTSPMYLAASPPLPADPAQRDAVIAALADLAAARNEIEAYRLDRARAHLARVEASPLRDGPSIAPGLRLVRAILARAQGDIAQAEQQLSDAYYAARASDDDASVTTALSHLLMLAVEKSPEDIAAQGWLRAALADAERLAQRTPWLAARLYGSCARVADAFGDSAAALRHIARARELARPGDEILTGLDHTEAAVLMWSGKVPEGIALYDRAIERAVEQLGPEHPNVGAYLSDYAASLVDASRFEEALRVAERAVAIVDKAADPADRIIDQARVNLAAVLSSTGNEDHARPMLETVRAHYVAHYGVRSTMVANVDMNLAHVLMNTNENKRAIELLEESLTTTEQLLGRDRIEVAQVLFNLAIARRNDGHLAAARADALRCADIYARTRPGVDRHRLALGMVATIANQLRDHPAALAATETALAFTTRVDDKQSVALNQLERARALIATKRPAEARPLLEAARATYLAEQLTARVQDIDRLLAKAR